MIRIENFIKSFSSSFAGQHELLPWEITRELSRILLELIAGLDNNYDIHNGIAVHRTASVEKGAILKPPVIIGAYCFVGAHAYLRGGVYLHDHAIIGTGCEIKTSIVFGNSTIAHFNFIGDSLVGSNVNFEAGSVTANHYNERENKSISVFYNARVISTGVDKFGALVGDNSKIGANAVLSPGTILPANSLVKRLELVDQVTENKEQSNLQ